jgi:hypothetical protein
MGGRPGLGNVSTIQKLAQAKFILQRKNEGWERYLGNVQILCGGLRSCLIPYTPTYSGREKDRTACFWQDHRSGGEYQVRL